MTHRYTAASDGWLAFITPSRQLFVGAAVDAGLVDRLWTRIRDERGPAGVLEALTAAGLFATPPFAFVELADGGVDVIVRGEAVVRSGADQVSGAGATTWIERRLPGGSVGVALAGSGSLELPIEAGVVRASAFATGAAVSGGFAAPVAAAVAPPAAPPAEPLPAETVVSLPEEPAASAPAATAATVAASAEGDGYDYLFGETRYVSVQDAAVRAEDPAEEPAVEEAPAGDHDGSTVLASSITRTRGGRRPRGSAPVVPADPSLAVVLPGGAREVLDQALVLGRAPSVSGVPAGQLPRLVTLSGGDQDISRSHVRLALEGGTVVVTDLHSRNGTTIVLPNGESQKLRGGEPTPVIVGTLVDLGGGVELRIEEI